MLSLESEYRELHAVGAIDDAAASRGIAAESGKVFSVAQELRVVIYSAVAAITTGIGIILNANLQRIGPTSLIIGLAVAATGCYAPAIRARLRHATRSTVADYLLLLGALIVSADLGYAESQFHWLGPHWSALICGGAPLRRPSQEQLLNFLVLAMPVAGYAWGWSWTLQRAATVRWLPVCLLLLYGAGALWVGIRRRRHWPIVAFLACLSCVAYE